MKTGYLPGELLYHSCMGVCPVTAKFSCMAILVEHAL